MTLLDDDGLSDDDETYDDVDRCTACDDEIETSGSVRDEMTAAEGLCWFDYQTKHPEACESCGTLTDCECER